MEPRGQRRKQSLTAWCWQWGGDTVNLTQANLDDTLTHLALVALGGPQGRGLLISDVWAGAGGGCHLVCCSVISNQVCLHTAL